jgi:hypothetical protein
MWRMMDERSLRKSPWTASSVPRSPADLRVGARPSMTPQLAAALLPSTDALAGGEEGTGVSAGETGPTSGGSAEPSGDALSPGAGVPSPYAGPSEDDGEADADQERLAQLTRDLAALKSQLDGFKRMLADFKRARDSTLPGSQQWMAFNAMCINYQNVIAQLQVRIRSLMDQIAALAG